MQENRTKRTEAAERAALAQDPYTAFAAQRREAMRQDPFYPVYHFTAPEGIMNDPNGLCFWKGRWHLFYQAFPPEKDIHWGHAVSEDLIHWEDLPYALAPEQDKGCWSGAAFVEENRVIAMYHGHEYGNIVAVSEDPLLLHWEKVGLLPIGTDGSYAVFDPCIWKEDDGFYYALSGSASPQVEGGRNVRTEYLFRSADLRDWEYLHPLVKGDFDCIPGEDGACPYFWPIGDKHILLHYSHHSGGKYLIGRYDREAHRLLGLNGGSFNTPWINSSQLGGVHAPSAAPDGRGGLVTVFNLVEAFDGSSCRQIVSLPRRMTLCGPQGDELASAPAPELSCIRGDHLHREHIAIPKNQEVVLPGVRGNVMELQLEFAAAESFPTLEIGVLRSEGAEEVTRIRCYRHRGLRNWDYFNECGGWDGRPYDTVIMLDNTDSSLLPGVTCRAPELGSFFLRAEETLRLQIFLDRGVIEVFVNDRLCLSSRVYPGREDSLGVSVRARECGTELLRLDAWKYDGSTF